MEKFNSPEREWKKFYVQLGGRAVELCQSETILFTHSEEYKAYDLIQNPSGLYPRYENEEVFNELTQEEFSEFFQQYPNPKHEEAMNAFWQKEVMEGAELILELEDEK